MYKLFIFLTLTFLFISKIFSQSSNTNTKQGGICFRIDDNHSISEYLEYASIFQKYNQNFTFALNLDITNIDQNYINGVIKIRANGNEMMDHTPSHCTNLFNTIFSPDDYKNIPGVHNIIDNTIQLEFAPIDISKAKTSGYVDINGNIATSKDLTL
jgi:hypothetical protein